MCVVKQRTNALVRQHVRVIICAITSPSRQVSRVEIASSQGVVGSRVLNSIPASEMCPFVHSSASPSLLL